MIFLHYLKASSLKLSFLDNNNENTCWFMPSMDKATLIIMPRKPISDFFLLWAPPRLQSQCTAPLCWWIHFRLHTVFLVPTKSHLMMIIIIIIPEPPPSLPLLHLPHTGSYYFAAILSIMNTFCTAQWWSWSSFSSWKRFVCFYLQEKYKQKGGNNQCLCIYKHHRSTFFSWTSYDSKRTLAAREEKWRLLSLC